MTKLIIIYWRDIPTQVIAQKSRREQFKITLHPRFEKAIDKCAMRCRETSDDDYLASFRKSKPIDIEGEDLEKIATERASEIEEEFTSDLLDEIIKNLGTRK